MFFHQTRSEYADPLSLTTNEPPDASRMPSPASQRGASASPALSIRLHSSAEPSTSSNGRKWFAFGSNITHPFASALGAGNHSGKEGKQGNGVVEMPRSKSFEFGLNKTRDRESQRDRLYKRENRKGKGKERAVADHSFVGSWREYVGGLWSGGSDRLTNGRTASNSALSGAFERAKSAYEWLLADEGERERNYEEVSKEIEKKARERERKRLSTIFSEEEEEEETQEEHGNGSNGPSGEEGSGVHKRHLSLAFQPLDRRKRSISFPYSHSPKHSLSVSSRSPPSTYTTPLLPPPPNNGSLRPKLRRYLFVLPIQYLRISRLSYILLLFLLFLGAFEMLPSFHASSPPPPLLSLPYPSLHFHRHHHHSHTSSLLRASSSIPARFQLHRAGFHAHPTFPIRYPSQNAFLAPPHMHHQASAGRAGADTTAILLSWKRRENVRVIVEWLCRFEFFAQIWIWNNDPDSPLDRSFFRDSTCPPHLIRITNAPTNQFFAARFLACSQASTPYCYIQDDDFLVPSLRLAYSTFLHIVSTEDKVGLRGNEEEEERRGLLTLTDGKTAAMGRWEWCFFSSSSNHNHTDRLHTCFAWLGTGAFTTRWEAKAFVRRMMDEGRAGEENAMSDIYFVVERNEPPYVVETRLVQFQETAKDGGYSDGEDGRRRNRRHILNAVLKTAQRLRLPMESEGGDGRGGMEMIRLRNEDTGELAVEVGKEPSTHFVRAASVTDVSGLWTNLPLYPSPTKIDFPYSLFLSNATGMRTLNEWEEHLGWIGRGWLEPPAGIWDVGETWAVNWGYGGAVDGDFRTAFRSIDVIRAGDAVGLVMLRPVEVDARAVLHLVLEYGSEHPLKSITVLDWDCLPTPHRSTLPSISLPDTPLLSQPGRRILEADDKMGWWGKRRRRGRVLEECAVMIEPEERWRFVRVRAERELNVGWGVYEIWVDLAGEDA
ncbi:hypothetical protein BT69DRAFT_1337198 [Atractiella rhizophila]|nr:hypothetical protein BT69DRAFT_1337198 [Atractiella rhizophila]